MKKLIILLFFGVFIAKTQAQEYFPNNESIPNKNNYYTAFTNVKIYVTPTQLTENLTIAEDAEYDVFLPLAEQKFKVTLK
jgi:hypothetical protein